MPFGAQPNDPAHVAAFKVTVDGLQIPHVTEVSGLTQEVDKVEVKQQMADGKFVISQTTCPASICSAGLVSRSQRT